MIQLGLLLVVTNVSFFQMNLVHIFPTEDQMTESNFWLQRPDQLIFNDGQLFVLDWKEQGVHVFQKNGDYERFIGGLGDGPGELYNPHCMAVSKNKLYIADSHRMIHQFSRSDGTFNYRQPFLNLPLRMVSDGQGLFVTAQSPDRRSYFFRIDENLKPLGVQQSPFPMDEKVLASGQLLTLKKAGEKVYMLQRHALGFRVYDEQGSLLQKGRLQYGPEQDPRYQELGMRWAYKSFDIFHKHWVCFYFGIGEIHFAVFDSSGLLIHRFTQKLPALDDSGDQTIYYTGDIAFAQENNENSLYVAVLRPVPKILKFQVKETDFIP